LKNHALVILRGTMHLVNPPENIAPVTALGKNPLGDPHMGTMHLGEPPGNHALNLIDLTLMGSLVDPTIPGTMLRLILPARNPPWLKPLGTIY
jgi:hypothetical protein